MMDVSAIGPKELSYYIPWQKNPLHAVPKGINPHINSYGLWRDQDMRHWLVKG